MDPVLQPFSPEFEITNTILPAEALDYQQLLSPLCSLPHLSTFAIAVIIQALTRQLPEYACYLNVGSWYGFTLFAAMLGNPQALCLGVDDFSNQVAASMPSDLGGNPGLHFLPLFRALKSERHHFYEMDFRCYFREQHSTPIGLYMYDADHDAEAQFNGLKLAEPWLIPGAYLIVDDTNWLNVYAATLQFIAQSKHNYQVVLDCFTAHNAHPTFWNGLLIFQKMD